MYTSFMESVEAHDAEDRILSEARVCSIIEDHDLSPSEYWDECGSQDALEVYRWLGY